MVYVMPRFFFLTNCALITSIAVDEPSRKMGVIW